jgi:hypothetical protein
MKKLLLGLAAMFALGVAAPAFAEDAPAGDKPADAKKEKKGKKGKKEEAKPAEGGAAPAEAPKK